MSDPKDARIKELEAEVERLRADAEKIYRAHYGMSRVDFRHFGSLYIELDELKVSLREACEALEKITAHLNGRDNLSGTGDWSFKIEGDLWESTRLTLTKLRERHKFLREPKSE